MSLILAGLLMLATPQSSTLTFDAQIKSLRDVLAGLKLSEGEKNAYSSNLNLSEAAASRGDHGLALYYIRSTMPNLLAYSAMERDAAALKSNEDLDKYWKDADPAYKATHTLIIKAQYTDRPMAVRALIEEALTQAETLNKTGVLFGKETNVASGVFYVRQAGALLEFASLAAKQPGKASDSKPTLSAMPAAQEKLRGDIIDAYIQHGGGEEPAKPLIVTAHSRMKIADDLIAEGRVSGAAMVIVQGKFELALALAMINKAQPVAEPLKELLAQRRREASNLSDPSVALVYINLAEDRLKAGQEPDLLRAKVLLEEVIPFAFEVLK
jgi:hypothetical protein